MGAQDETEDVLRQIHILFQKAEPISGMGKKVIIDKEPVMDLLKKLNECMIKMMDEHEISKAGRDRATRQQKREQANIVKETKDNAEDIYAAAMMYSDHALDEVNEIINRHEEALEKTYNDLKDKLEKEKKKLMNNKAELKTSLMTLKDMDKYMQLINDENARIAKEKTSGNEEPPELSPYADVKAEIKINPAYFEAMGLPLEES